jgi:hypothetical protein
MPVDNGGTDHNMDRDTPVFCVAEARGPPVILAMTWRRYADRYGHIEDSWNAAYAALLLEKTVQFETPGGNVYVAPLDDGRVGLEPSFIIVGHEKLERLQRLDPGASRRKPAVDRSVPVVVGPLRKFRLVFGCSPELYASCIIEASSREAAEAQARTSFRSIKDDLWETATGSWQHWDPEPKDFVMMGVEEVT